MSVLLWTHLQFLIGTINVDHFNLKLPVLRVGLIIVGVVGVDGSIHLLLRQLGPQRSPRPLAARSACGCAESS